jgi:predicted nucleic acid-binding protein
MSAFLLDTNLLIALAWPQHVHHGEAHAWFGKVARGAWATCPITQLGFIRISSNPK